MFKKKPIVAIMYDFDKTLSTKDMQEYSFIPQLNMDADAFWDLSDKLARKYNMDHILSTMLLMVQKSKEDGIDVSREAFVKHGANVKFHNGVDTWFKRISKLGADMGLEIRHYIISCGLRPMIEGSAIGKEVDNIFACDFVYDDDGNPIWPAMAINYSNKIQFLYRINKGVEDVFEHKKLNMLIPQSERVVPFSNMIYIGDGFTDIPSMRLIRMKGGYAVGVYEHKEDGQYLVNDGRVDFYVKADYGEGSEMEHVVKAMLDKIRATNYFEYLSGVSYYKGSSEN